MCEHWDVRRGEDLGTVEEIVVLEHTENSVQELAHGGDEGLHFGFSRAGIWMPLKAASTAEKFIQARIIGSQIMFQFADAISVAREAYALSSSPASNIPEFQSLSPNGEVPPTVAPRIVQQFLLAVRSHSALGQVYDDQSVEIAGRGYHGRVK